MARDGSGNYNLPTGNPVTTGTTISSTVHNNTMSDVATALTASIAKDGQTTPTADLPMGTQKHTNVGDAAARNQYAGAGQVQDSDFIVCGSVAGTNAVTASLAPALTSYSAGMMIVMVPAANNTGATTLAINGLTALDVLKDDGDALASGDLVADVPAFLVLDGAGDDFFLLNPQSAPSVADSQLSANVPLKDAANTFTQAINGASAPLDLASAQPGIYFRETDAAANNQVWLTYVTGETFRLRVLNDALNSASDCCIVNRTDNTIDSVAFTSTSFTVNGAEVFKANSQVDHDATTNFVANEHVDHTSVTLSAGSGLSGGGTIAANRSFAVDLAGLTQATSNDIAGGDELLLNDGGTNKAIRWQDFGVTQTDDSTTSPLSAADLTYANRIYNCNNASAISAVIPANASVAYPVGTILGFTQIGAGQVTVSVTSDTLQAPIGAKTRAQWSTIYARKYSATGWVVSGDASA